MIILKFVLMSTYPYILINFKFLATTTCLVYNNNYFQNLYH